MKAPPASRRARGVVALEAAMTLILVAVIVPALVVLGNVLRQHLVLETVAHQSARQLATMPRLHMSKSLAYQEAELRIRTQSMAALAAAGIDTAAVSYQVACEIFCGSPSMPQQVKVRLVATVQVGALGPAVAWLISTQGIVLHAEAVLRYEN